MLIALVLVLTVIITVTLRSVGPMDTVACEIEQVGMLLPKLGDIEHVRFTLPTKLPMALIVTVAVAL